MTKEGTIPENSEGPGNGLSEDARPIAKPGRRTRKGERMSAEQRQKISEGVRRAQAERKAREAGKPEGDHAPKAKPSQSVPGDTKEGDLALIRELLSTLLVAPSAIGAATGDPWLTQHFMVRGPQLSKAIVDEAARDDSFRAYLVKIAKAARGVSIIGALAMYLAPPLMHYGMIPGAAMLGVPVKGGGGPPRPEPGVQAPFIAPERGPAIPPQEQTPAPPFDPEGFAEAFPEVAGDELAAELAAHANGGEIMPPLPMEPV